MQSEEGDDLFSELLDNIFNWPRRRHENDNDVVYTELLRFQQTGQDGVSSPAQAKHYGFRRRQRVFQKL